MQSRFFKLRDAGVLTHRVIREGGTYSYFGIGEKYIELISSNVNVDDENIEDESSTQVKEASENLGTDNSVKSVDENKDSVDVDYQSLLCQQVHNGENGVQILEYKYLASVEAILKW